MTTAFAQPGVLSDPSVFAEYLTFVLKPGGHDAGKIGEALGGLAGIEKAISQKDQGARLFITVGVSASAWQSVFPVLATPKELRPFPALEDGGRRFPATEGDIFIMVKSGRMDLNFQAAKYIARSFAPFAELIEDIQGFQYLDGRDMIDFVDGTENPKDAERMEAVLVRDDIDIHKGGSYLTVQRYVDKNQLRDWDRQSTEYQEQVVGRTKMDNIELDSEAKPPWAHTAKSKVEKDGEEIKMFRQNRPYGTALEHGTMFVGFAASPSVIETSLKQMITADEAGHYDRLLDFVEARTGCHYFILSQTLLDELGGD